MIFRSTFPFLYCYDKIFWNEIFPLSREEYLSKIMKQRKTPDDDVREKLIFNYQEMEKEAYERVLAPQLRLRVFVFFSIFHYTYNVHTTYTS